YITIINLFFFLILNVLNLLLCKIKSANIDKYNILEIPIQHSVSKQRQMEPNALQKYKECVAKCNNFPIGQKPGKHNLASIQKCSDELNNFWGNISFPELLINELNAFNNPII
ncbi:hypothetical protein Mgra_00009096, partial [Meloidogyne graminicola]